MPRVTRRQFVTATTAALIAGQRTVQTAKAAPAFDQAPICITLDLEMSRHYPNWQDMHWDYEKGNLDEPTKRYALECARRVKRRGGVIHFFALGRTMEQADVDWLREIASLGHSIGNHTYDHIHMKVARPEDLQFRFERSPWLVAGKTTAEVIAENIRLAHVALSERAGVQVDGFRTPGGFSDGLADRADLQQILLSQGYRWVSSKYPAHPIGEVGKPVAEETLHAIVEAQDAAQPFVYPSGLVEVPMSPISDVGAFRTGRWQLADFVEATRRSVRRCIERGTMFDFLSHPSCLVVTDPEFRAVDLICDLVENSAGRAELVTLGQVADRVAKAARMEKP